jgi:hypothetical protein
MKNAKAIIGVVVIFILGAIVGTLITRMVYEARVEAIVSGDGQAREEALVKRLGKRLDLDGQQRDQVRIIIHNLRNELKGIYREVQPQLMAAREANREKIKEILTPGQIAKYDTLLAEGKER